MVYKKIHYSFHGAFIIPWNTHDATFMVINREIQHFHELIMGISWEICLVVGIGVVVKAVMTTFRNTHALASLLNQISLP